MAPDPVLDAYEQERLAALWSYVRPGEDLAERFAPLTRAAALVAETPVATVSLLDGQCQVPWASVGFDIPVVPRALSFCDTVVRTAEPFEVADLSKDPRFAANPFVSGAPSVRFYAGMPIVTADGWVLGSLCVMDYRPRSLDERQRALLATLAGQVMAQLELVRAAREAQLRRDEAVTQAAMLDAVLDSVDVAVLWCDADGRMLRDNAFGRELVGFAVGPGDSHTDVARTIAMFEPDGTTPVPVAEQPLARALREGDTDREAVIHPPDRPARRVKIHARALTGADGVVVGAMCASQDVTDAYRREQELAARVGDVERLAAASRTILGGDDAGQAACDVVRTIVGAQQVTLLVPAGHATLVAAATTEPALRTFSMPLAAGSLASAAFVDQRAIYSDPHSDGRQPGVLGRAIEGVHGPMGAALLVPVVHEHRTQGLLAITSAAALHELPPRVFDLLDIVVSELATGLERERLRREMVVQAHTDPLTGLPNRRTWDDRVAYHLAAVRGGSVCMALLDLDHFKAFNDTRGHEAGDGLLRAVAGAWSAGLRSGDLLARLGGEEFGLVLPDCSVEHALVVADQLRQRVPAGQTVSIGVAQHIPYESATSWYVRADRALYAAKAGGRDRVFAAEQTAPA